MKVKRTFESILRLSDTIPLMIVGVPYVQSFTNERVGEFQHKLIEHISDKFFFEENFLVAFVTKDFKLISELITQFLKTKYNWNKFETSVDTIQYKTNIINFFSPDEEFSLVNFSDYDVLVQFEDVEDYSTFNFLSTVSKKSIIITLDDPNSIYYETDDTYRQIYVSDYAEEVSIYLNNNLNKLLLNEERYRRGNFDGIINDRF